MGWRSQNGSAVLAMTGDQCVAIAADRRFSVQMLTVATDCEKIFQINDRIFLGLAGMITDVQTVHEQLRFDVNLLELREERQIEPEKFAALVKSLLYKHRFGAYHVEPVIAGLDPVGNVPFLASSDMIGSLSEDENFSLAGTASEELYGTCESMWRPGMNPDELFECIAKCLVASVERDSLAGWGGIVHIITPDQIITKEIKTRVD
jgi:20S proteasome subunit beta 3